MLPCKTPNCTGNCSLPHFTFLLDPPAWFHSSVLPDMLEIHPDEARLLFYLHPQQFFIEYDNVYLHNFIKITEQLNLINKPKSPTDRYCDLRKIEPQVNDKKRFYEMYKLKTEKVETEMLYDNENKDTWRGRSYNADGRVNSFNKPYSSNYNPDRPNYTSDRPNYNRPYNPDRPNYIKSDRPPYNPDRPPYNPDRPPYNPDRSNYVKSDRPNYNSDRQPYTGNRPPYNPDRPNYNQRSFSSTRFNSERPNYVDRPNYSDRSNYSDRPNYNPRYNTRPYNDSYNRPNYKRESIPNADKIDLTDKVEEEKLFEEFVSDDK